MASFHYVILGFEKNIVRLSTKDFFSRSFHSGKFLATSKTWARTLDPDPEKSGT